MIQVNRLRRDLYRAPCDHVRSFKHKFGGQTWPTYGLLENAYGAVANGA